MSAPVTLPRPKVWLMACAAGVAIAGNFSLQPLLPDVAISFAAPPAAAGWIAAAPSLGYAAGLLFFVPLGDRFAPGRLIALQMVGLALCLVVVALAPNLALLLVASACGGMLASAAAQCAALGGRLGGARRGRVVGTIAMGMALGILLGRVVGGALGALWGWRMMTAFLAAVTLTAAGAMALWAPRLTDCRTSAPVAALVRAVPHAFRDTPSLGLLTAAGGAWFAMFSGIWAVLALYLASPAFGFGPAVAGSFGLIGAAGALSSQLAGRAGDRFGAATVMPLALGISGAGLLTLLLLGRSLWGLAIGILLMDIGSFAAQSVNQALILGLSPARSGRDYSAYMVVYYAIGTLGAFIGPLLFAHLGWHGVCLWSLALCLTAVVCARIGALRAESLPDVEAVT